MKINHLSYTMVTHGDQIVVCPHGKETAENLQLVGKAVPEWANMLGASLSLYRNSIETTKALESLLTILENQGLDRLARSLQEIIAAQKLIQQVAIDGPKVLTGR